MILNISIFIFSLLICSIDSLAVVSIDLGCEWIKMGIVKPGMPMEIILTPESSRKFLNVVGIKHEEILIGEPALTFCQRKPKDVFLYPLELIGKNLYNSEIEMYHQYFSQYELTTTRKEKAFAFIHKNETYVPEELIAMILAYCKEVAMKFAEEHAIVGYMLTVPSYFNQAERKALIKAAEIADVKLIQIINDNAAVALNYGLFRQKSFNSTPQHYVFFDMGACGTHASVIDYQIVQTRVNDSSSIHPQLTIKGFGFDRKIGGREFQIRLRDYMASYFNNEVKHPGHPNLDVTRDPRAMNKLYVEAGKALKILSANTETVIQIENLIEEINFKIAIKRETFESICQDLFDRTIQPLEDAISSSGLQHKDIQQIILFGGSTRIPYIQNLLNTYAKKYDLEVSKSLNTDEAAALGAVYQAAYLSQGFRAKRFIIKDTTPYPIKIEFDKDLRNLEEVKLELDAESLQDTSETTEQESMYRKTLSSASSKHIEKVLMPRGNPCPQKKVITFNKNFEDFTFNVTYGDLGFLNQEQIKNFASLNLTQITVKGIKPAIKKYLANQEGVEFKGIKAHFAIDDNCLVHLDKVDIHFERTGSKPEESTFSKIGSKIKNFFTGVQEQDGVENVVEKSSYPPEDVGANLPPSKDQGQNDKFGDDKDGVNQVKKLLNNTFETINGSTVVGNLTTPNDTTPETFHIIEPLKFEQVDLDFPQMSQTEVWACQQKLRIFKEREHLLKELAELRNNLESTIFNTKEKFKHDEVFRNFSKPEERESVLAKMDIIQEWYDLEGTSADKKDLKLKLDEIKSALKPIDSRIIEYDKIFKSLDKMYRVLNDSHGFLEVAKNLSLPSSAMPIFTPIEISKFEEIVLSTTKWFNETVEQLNSAELTKDPTIKSKDIKEKSRELDREVNYLRNKGREEAMKQAKKLTENVNFKDLKDSISKNIPTEKDDVPPSGPQNKDTTASATSPPREKSNDKAGDDKKDQQKDKHPPDEL